MNSKIFSLACSGMAGSWPYAWQLELGDRILRQRLAAGVAVSFKLSDGTQMCLKMASAILLLVESVDADGERSIEWYWADRFTEDGEEISGAEFLKRIYNRARRKKPEELLGAFAE